VKMRRLPRRSLWRRRAKLTVAIEATARHAFYHDTTTHRMKSDVSRRNFPNGVGCIASEFPEWRRMKFYYTYILESEKTMNRFYIGFTEDLESRLKSHNHGNNPHTSKYKPWRIKTAIAFTDRQKALDFEVYLKSPSGRAFTKKRL